MSCSATCSDPEPQQFTALADVLGRLALCLAAIARFAADTDYDLRDNSD